MCTKETCVSLNEVLNNNKMVNGNDCTSKEECTSLSCMNGDINNNNLMDFTCVERVCYCTKLESAGFLTWFDFLNFCVFPVLTMIIIIMIDKSCSKKSEA